MLSLNFKFSPIISILLIFYKKKKKILSIYIFTIKFENIFINRILSHEIYYYYLTNFITKKKKNFEVLNLRIIEIILTKIRQLKARRLKLNELDILTYFIRQ